MTTTTPNITLTLYDSSTDQSVTFADFRAVLAGTASTSNFYRIDTAVGTHTTQIAALQLTKGAVGVSATYSAPNTYVATVASIASYYTGLGIVLSVDTTTDGTTTLNINSLGAKSLMKVNSSGTPINLTGSDLTKGGFYFFQYDGTRFLWVSANSGDQVHIVGTAGNVVTVNTDLSLLGTTTQAGLIGATTHAATTKATPVDADEIPLSDSAASFALKKLTWANLKATLKAYTDGLYAALAGLSTQVFSVAAATAVAHAVRADQIQGQSLQMYTTGGSSTAYTITTLGTPIALTTGERWNVIFNATAGATPTLNRDSKGAKALKYYNSAGAKTACSATNIFSGMHCDIVYDGTDYVVLNPSPFSGAASSTDGNVAIFSGTSGKLLKDSSMAYVDKTSFTPVVEGTTSAGTGAYTYQLGTYSRIGNVVFFHILIVWTAHDGSGNLRIAGLPLTAADNDIAPIPSIWFSNLTLSGTEYKVQGLILSNTKTVNIYEVAGGASAFLPLDTAGTIRMSGQYFV